jgi:hypothetical protein
MEELAGVAQTHSRQLHTADRTGSGDAAAGTGLLPLRGIISICILRMEMYQKKLQRSEIKEKKKQTGRLGTLFL